MLGCRFFRRRTPEDVPPGARGDRRARPASTRRPRFRCLSPTDNDDARVLMRSTSSGTATCTGTSRPRTGSPGGPATRSTTTPSRAPAEHGDGAVVLLHTWPRATATPCRSSQGLRAGGGVLRDGRRAGGASVSRRPGFAVDGGGSKVDAASWRATARARRARVGPSTTARATAQFSPRSCSAVEAASREPGADPARAPLAALGVFCLAGADLPSDERRSAAGAAARLDRRERPAQRHLRGAPRRDRPELGRRRRLRVRHQLLGRRRPTAGSTASRPSAGSRRLGRRRRHRPRRPCGTRSAPRTGADDRTRLQRPCPPTSACAPRAR